MEGKNWDELKKYKYELENTCNKVLISLKKKQTNKKTAG